MFKLYFNLNPAIYLVPNASFKVITNKQNHFISK